MTRYDGDDVGEGDGRHEHRKRSGVLIADKKKC